MIHLYRESLQNSNKTANPSSHIRRQSPRQVDIQPPPHHAHVIRPLLLLRHVVHHPLQLPRHGRHPRQMRRRHGRAPRVPDKRPAAAQQRLRHDEVGDGRPGRDGDEGHDACRARDEHGADVGGEDGVGLFAGHAGLDEEA